MKYIAYGSNMEQGPMARRCPAARLLCLGELRDHRLEFYRYATVELAPGDSVPVAVWEIGAEDERALDDYEGFPELYRKEVRTVTTEDGGIEGMIYLMNDDMKWPLPPTRGYYGGIRDAYERLGLGEKIGEVLEAAMGRCGGRKG